MNDEFFIHTSHWNNFSSLDVIQLPRLWINRNFLFLSRIDLRLHKHFLELSALLVMFLGDKRSFHVFDPLHVCVKLIRWILIWCCYAFENILNVTKVG